MGKAKGTPKPTSKASARRRPASPESPAAGPRQRTRAGAAAAPPEREALKAQQRRQNQARCERLRRQHRCITCGRKAVNRNHCEAHRQRYNRYRREHYRADPAARERKHQAEHAWYFATHPRACRWCGRPLTPEERTGRHTYYHAACRGVASKARGREHYHQTKDTAWYRAAHLRAVRRYQERMRQAGRCPICGRPTPAGMAVCPACAERRRAYEIQRPKASGAMARSRAQATQSAASRRPVRPRSGKRCRPG